ncbi:MAG: hypothetical protein PVI30_25550 [Myxococcales bacterium]|jgi:hypothetical protein
MFEVLLVVEAMLCALLGYATLRALEDADEAPEVALGQRAWSAARFGMAEARELGPLFSHLLRASRRGLREAHTLQTRIRAERAQAGHGRLGGILLRRRLQRSAELSELAHLVEQLEHMVSGVARYRAGLGGLTDLTVPLRCLELRERDPRIGDDRLA